MEPLRWILLFAGIAFIVFIYLFSRKRRQKNRQDEDIIEDDLPEFSARNWDDFDEGVGPVRVISAGGRSDSDDTGAAESGTSAEAHSAEAQGQTSDIIVLYILPKLDSVFSGSQINSSVQAMGLKFGDMNIYHFIKTAETDTVNTAPRQVFSLANMHEPGHFDPDTIHDLKSSGLTVFMQINTSVGVDALDDLTEMLQRSYQIAGLLDGRLCNHMRRPLTEQDAENYRSQVRQVTGVEAVES